MASRLKLKRMLKEATSKKAAARNRVVRLRMNDFEGNPGLA